MKKKEVRTLNIFLEIKDNFLKKILKKKQKRKRQKFIIGNKKIEKCLI